MAMPGDEGNAQVEHQVIAEQRDVIAATAGQQQRRGEAAERTDDRQRAGILQHGERRRQGGNRHHAHEHRHDRQHAVETKRGEQREVQHRHRAALQHLRVGGAARAQPPTQDQQHQRSAGDAGQAQLHRHVHVFRRELGEESQADEQNRHTQLDDGVAAEDPLPDGRQRISHGARRAVAGPGGRARRNGRRARHRPPACRRLGASGLRHVAPQGPDFGVMRVFAPQRIEGAGRTGGQIGRHGTAAFGGCGWWHCSRRRRRSRCPQGRRCAR